VAADRLADEARGLHVLDELLQVARAGLAALGRADRLLHGGELALDDARAGELRRVADEAGLEARERFELQVDEHLVGALDAVGGDELGGLGVARQEQVVGALVGDRDAHAGLVDVGESLERRAGRHEVGDRDLEVGRREGDLVGALRLVAEEGDVPHALLHAVGELAGGVELDVVGLDAEALCELAPEVGGDALRRAIGRVLQHQQEVGVVEADAELAGGRELGDGGGRDAAHGFLAQ